MLPAFNKQSLGEGSYFRDVRAPRIYIKLYIIFKYQT